MRTLVLVVATSALALSGCRKKLNVELPDSGAPAAAAATSAAATDTASAAASAAAATDSVEPLASLAPTKPPPPVVAAAAARAVKPAASAAGAAAAGEPKECALARKMKEKNLMREFDTLSKLCVQKGGKI